MACDGRRAHPSNGKRRKEQLLIRPRFGFASLVGRRRGRCAPVLSGLAPSAWFRSSGIGREASGRCFGPGLAGGLAAARRGMFFCGSQLLGVSARRGFLSRGPGKVPGQGAVAVEVEIRVGCELVPPGVRRRGSYGLVVPTGVAFGSGKAQGAPSSGSGLHPRLPHFSEGAPGKRVREEVFLAVTISGAPPGDGADIFFVVVPTRRCRRFRPQSSQRRAESLVLGCCCCLCAPGRGVRV